MTNSATAVIAAVTLMFLGIVGAVTVVIVTGHLTDASAGTIVLLVGLLAPTIAALYGLRQNSANAAKLDNQAEKLDTTSAKLDTVINGTPPKA